MIDKEMVDVPGIISLVDKIKVAERKVENVELLIDCAEKENKDFISVEFLKHALYEDVTLQKKGDK